jgi:hypothetical protein
VSGNQPSRRPAKKKAPAAAKGKGGSGGGQRGGRKRGGKKSNESAIDPKQPLWENPAGEAQVRGIVGSVRPAQHPTAVVRSLGDPPLGRYASTAPHYYDAVYRKAQQFAIAAAKANGVQVLEETEDDGADPVGGHESPG